MAVMKLVCGGCGAELSAHDRTCPRCGIVVEFPGQGNAGGQRGDAGQSGKKERQRESRKQGRGISPLHIPVIVVSLLFGGWAVYSEINREIPPVQEHDHPVQETDHSGETLEIERLQKLVADNPEDDTSLLRLANLLQDHSRHDQRYLIQAVETYQKYLALNPENENARVDLGICYFDLSRVDTVHGLSLMQRAITEIRTVAMANPEHQAAAFNLGIVSLNVGRTQESAEWFKRAVAINPGTDLGQRAQRLLEQHMPAEPVQ